ncbi:MAG: VapC toxin family PIN domain ribonuclease [Deltaproteobacteria bacterium CG23_combo_of_CG06-09_8_20_14_all_51_20]|nr:MAG: VapC toxin family PIN domain ribonuclease [Deltaproteobacteria bacterium CG23_combo_of_CG06-09_8_20_14_all_51_20]PJB38424.1 MAG: PIN domain nuclease [Deltaproteobacteria bacterium CG_4_9_14_3_um_filter_51_14]
MRADVLVDTSIWIEYFNHRHSENGEAVEDLLRGERVVITGIVVTELLQGAKLKNEFDAILDSIVSLPFLDAALSAWIEAGRLSYSLRKKGVTIPTTDVVLASLAIENQCLLFSLDSHFDRIPGLKRYSIPVLKTPS